MYWPEADFRISEIVKFGPLWAQKRQNWGKFFYLQTPKKGVYWPFLALILGTPTQALKILTVMGCLERVYQVSKPGKANQHLFWAFSDKRMILYDIYERPKWLKALIEGTVKHISLIFLSGLETNIPMVLCYLDNLDPTLILPKVLVDKWSLSKIPPYWHKDKLCYTHFIL